MIGIDIEQFIRDPYATGIQRVLQQLALTWPSDVGCEWVVPNNDGTFTLLDAAQAGTLLSLPFTAHADAKPGHDANHELRLQVAQLVAAYRSDRVIPKVRLGELLSLYDGWLLPEVSYLSSVLQRLDIFARSMPITMIGYDALPMTEPANYRFVPGTGANVSEYFRRLATADSVVCISEYSRTVILDALRRDRALATFVAHPGGDHLPIRSASRPCNSRPVFMRLGTMEGRKRPVEILRGFIAAIDAGVDAELLFVGNANASAQAINDEVEAAIADGYPVTWIRGASDAEVVDLMASADAFLSIGVEGYGIPVLEAIRMGTPVLFSGIQPAGDLMEGLGARRMAAESVEDIAIAFDAGVRGGVLAEVRGELAPGAVPTWSAFAADVARSAVSA